MSAEHARFRLFLTILLLLGAGTLHASEPSLEVQLPSAALSVGDPLRIRVLASGGENGLWGDLQADIPEDGDWALIEGPTPIPQSSPPAWELKIAPLKVGEITLPEISANWRPGDGEARKIRLEGGKTVTVATVIAPDDPAKPAPLKAPLGVQGFPWEWVLPLAALILLAAAVVLLLLRLRRRNSRDAESFPELPPWEEFRRAMLAAEERIGRDAADAVCDRMAMMLRRYLERRSERPAAEMTSAELRALARELQWPSEAGIGLQKVMQIFDAVRFARRDVSHAELKEAAETARAVARVLERHYLPPDLPPTGEASS